MIAGVVMLGSKFFIIAAGHALQHRDERRSLGKIAEHPASALDVPRSVCAVEDGGRCVLRKCVCNVRESCAAQVFKVWVAETRGRISAPVCVCVSHNVNRIVRIAHTHKKKSA